MPKPKAYVVDVDGTLFDVSRRLESCVREAGAPRGSRFWRCFLSPEMLVLDVPRGRMVGLVKRLHSRGYKIIILTGRPETLRTPTKRQLARAHIPHHRLLMRPRGDYRKDYEFKREALSRLKKRYHIVAVYDDSPEVRRVAVELGLEAREPP